MIDGSHLYLRRGRPGTGAGRTGALVVAGSSGRIDEARVDMLASHGVTALGARWFGGEGLPAVPREVPLEYFSAALDLLAAECGRLVILGLSYGAEAALLTACVDRRVDAVVAFAPTDVAWEGHIDDAADPPRSKWTRNGRPVPFVPLDRSWEPSGEPPAFVDFYLHSRAVAGPEVVEAAAIPVERIAGEVVLVAGGDDRVWPSASAARRIRERRVAAGLPTALVLDHAAGHPITLPGERPTASTERPYLVGGDETAPARLGRAAWPAVARVLGIDGH